MATLHFCGNLSRLIGVGGVIEETGSTVGEVLRRAIAHCPALGEEIFEEERLSRAYNVYVNNEDIHYLDELETAVADKDEVIIVYGVAGG
jgi:molybdopterin synthase sulfur carrier subunit